MKPGVVGLLLLVIITVMTVINVSDVHGNHDIKELLKTAILGTINAGLSWWQPVI